MQKQLLTVLFVFGLQTLFAQNMNNNYQTQWKKVEKAFQKGLNKTAQTEIEGILKMAKAENNSEQTIKALCNLRVAMRDRDEESRKNDIALFEKELTGAIFPTKQLLHSMLADLYWTYYEENRYKILNRTTVGETKTPKSDLATWSADDFYNKAFQHFNASLSDKEKSKAFPIKNISEILDKGKNTEKLRPTLYDFLVHRAIDYFKQEENELTKPAYSFEIDDEKAFASASTFCNATFNPDNYRDDSNSKKYTALKLYQEIIKAHLNDADPSALIDADIARIQFVNEKNVLPNKNELYRNALQSIAERFPNNEQGQMAVCLLAETYMQGSNNYGTRGYMNSSIDEKKIDYLKAKKLLDPIVEKFPDSEAGSKAAQLLQQINSSSLMVQTEKVVLPATASLALVNFKNIKTLYCKAIAITNEEYRKYFYQNEEQYKSLLKREATREWTVSLPESKDYKNHSTEIKIEALPLGVYALAFSESPNFEKNTHTSLSYVHVSKLAYIVNNPQDGSFPTMYVVNRESGEPQKNVTIKLWHAEYSYKLNKYEYKQGKTFTTNDKGEAKLIGEKINNSYSVELIQGNDDLYMYDQVSVYQYEQQPKNDQIREFLFTDRSMYRPNQTIYFKGIAVRTDANDKNKHEVIKNQDTHVTLYDVNGQQVSTMQLKTNDYGSFTGEFKAPDGLLSGQFSIRSDYGYTSIRIEEYKRPKFEVTYDTLRDSYKLNETIKVKGLVKAYAGNNIDGATVKYRVTRASRFPYYWCYYYWGMPSSPAMEIAHGTTTTKSDGSFEIDFKAIPDASVDKNSMPVFDYTIVADVTDVNGETRTGTTNVSVSYQSLTIKIEAEDRININDFNAVKIFTTNLSGTYIPSQVTLTLKKLKAPSKTLRSRQWQKVEINSIPEQEFRIAFPLDEYNGENNHLEWKEEKIAWSKTFNSTKEGIEYLQKTGTGNGQYVLEAKSKDKDGNEVMDKKYIRLISNNEALPNEHILVLKNKSKAEPNEQVILNMITPYETVYAMTHYRKQTPIVQLDGKKTGYASGHEIEWIVWNEKHQFTFDINEGDRGGMYTNGWFVKNNRFYQFREFTEVPYTNKELRITTETFRDKMLPSSEQEWKLKISGSKKDKISAELLATLYDASLDAFMPHTWNILGLYNSNYTYPSWNSYYSFALEQAQQVYYRPYKEFTYYEKSYSNLNWFGLNQSGIYRGRRVFMGGDRSSATTYMMDGLAVEAAAPMMTKSISIEDKDDAKANDKFTPPVIAESTTTQKTPISNPSSQISLRSNFQETAFFFPQLQTDESGNVILKFKAPDALTRWKLMAFGHTQDMKEGVLTKTTTTQKELMIVPNTPRFFREGDKMFYSAKVTNLSDKDLNVEAILELEDAITGKSVDELFKKLPNTQFGVRKGESQGCVWPLEIPSGYTNPILVKTTVRSENLSDGEQNVVPIVLNSMLVTETLPLPVKPNSTKKFQFDNLLNSKNSNTLKHYNLTVEYTANPAWYAIQALPYLTDYPYECAEQTFNRYYANAIATHIANSNPKIKEIFSQWNEKDTAALLSNLEKNQELKSALLQETPWVLEAKTESEQKRNIALLFNLNRMSKELERCLRELELMQTPNGGFTWFKGMPEDRFMTQYILTGIGRLMHIGVNEVGSENRIQTIIQRAIPYLDQKIKEDFDELKKHKADLSKQQIGSFQIQYLYMRSFFKDIPVQAQHKTAFDFYLKQSGKYWLANGKMMQAMSALALDRWNYKTNAQAIIKSLRENAIRNEEMGMYYKDLVNSYWWHQAPIESQALLIECFKEVAQSEEEVDELKIWLLKNKQTTNWKTTKATADACYALLLNGTYWLAAQPEVEINLGNKLIQSKEQQQQAGTGYFKTAIPKEEIKSEMGNISVHVKSSKSVGTTWGAVYWQYFENLDKISPDSYLDKTGLKLNKQLYKISNTDKGEILTAITENSPLHVGDKVKVRIELRVDRPLEYVHMKDMRGACFEPVNVISNYKYQGGLGYYEATKDLATNFFFHYLQKGTYVFEYPMFVTNKGDFSNGIATIQCMYAPEFSSHSNGIRVNVK
jgi:uncharacterized protein YfaS (alpha-2-macroglobulin family)